MYDEVTQAFAQCVLYKLNKNRAKGKWETGDLAHYFQKLREEIDELEDEVRRAMIGQSDNLTELVLESSDVAAYALIIAAVACREMNTTLEKVSEDLHQMQSKAVA